MKNHAGLYSKFDSGVLYNTIRFLQPKRILELGCMEGKTTKTVIDALLNNPVCDQKPTYYIFEKNIQYKNTISKYVSSIKNIDIIIADNIINNLDRVKHKDIDFILIDGNHDHILAKWYIKNLIPLLNNGGIFHVHDIYYNKNGNGWEDVGFEANPQDHSDIVNKNILYQLYGNLVNDIYEHKECFEEDIIKRFYLNNSSHISFVSTLSLGQEWGNSDPFNCSMYFTLNNKEQILWEV